MTLGKLLRIVRKIPHDIEDHVESRLEERSKSSQHTHTLSIDAGDAEGKLL